MSVHGTISDAVLHQIAQQCKELIHLNMCCSTPASECTSAGLRAVIQGCPKLKSVSMLKPTDTCQFYDVITQYPNIFTFDYVDCGSFNVMEMSI
jgi:hypothetical protein